MPAPAGGNEGASQRCPPSPGLKTRAKRAKPFRAKLSPPRALKRPSLSQGDGFSLAPSVAPVIRPDKASFVAPVIRPDKASLVAPVIRSSGWTKQALSLRSSGRTKQAWSLRRVRSSGRTKQALSLQRVRPDKASLVAPAIRPDKASLVAPARPQRSAGRVGVTGQGGWLSARQVGGAGDR
ncbi:MAG: hypothetical protein H6631_06005 [Anaerolineaceae bacterium]|nr:hypothetical protein [Anaerolineaceae bacterium]